MDAKALSWHRYHIGAAIHAATKSKDQSTRVGCVLVGHNNQVLTTGFNGFARGVREIDSSGVMFAPRWQRPRKYNFCVHAELNAILNAARHGVALDGCTAYLNFAPCCCTGCANALVQVGCKAIIGPDIPFPGVGAGNHYDVDTDALAILLEGGVQLITVPMGCEE